MLRPAMYRCAPALMLALCMGACMAGGPQPRALGSLSIEDLMAGGRLPGALLERAIREAGRYPLGSEDNPVRADMPVGQRAYLGRLRCPDGAPPEVKRLGLSGKTPFGSLVDRFDVRCAGSFPQRTVLHIDMYHPANQEPLPPSGFTVAVQ